MNDFHFIRPLWLSAIIVLIVAIYLLKKYRISQSGWQQLLPKHLSKALIDSQSQGRALSLTLPFIIGLLTITALAGPTWKKLPQPVYQVARGSVMIMDMSYSMYATDIAPNRLTRARYKAIDLLDNISEGEIGLIAYAGDAFTISPLTEDINNIKLLLPSLTPDLMPELGSNPLAALTLASEMLRNAGHLEGDIYWFTDGIESSDIQDITEWSTEFPYHINIMGIGSKTGAPIKLTNGELMKDRNGGIIIPKLTVSSLKGVASRAKGNYVTLSNDEDDIENLMVRTVDLQTDKKAQSLNTGDQWQEFGPYLLLIILPLVLSYFRRGVLLSVIPCFILLMPSTPVHADIWQDLWKTKDQQGQQSYQNKAFEQAAEQFKNPLWQGSAHYQAENYQQALESFQQSDSAEALYNQGNALAKLQQLDEAIEAYDKALAKEPNMADAKANKALLEQLKQQQEQQQNQDQDQDHNKDQDQEQQDKQDQQKSKENKDQQQSDEQNEQEQNQQSSDDQKSQDQQKNEQEKQQKEQSEAEKEEQKQEQENKQSQAEKDKEEKEQEDVQAQQVQGQLDKETEQKYKQLLNKVTDDPYLLLRNKMQLEYQKRRQNRSRIGVNKKW